MDRSLFDRLTDKFNISTNVQLSSSSEPVLSAEDEETLSSVCHSVCFILGDSIDAGKGTLYLTTRQVVWVSAAHTGLAIALRYQQIVVHAISRDASTHAQPCIYLQLDEGSEDMGVGGGGDGEDEETEEDEHSAEVRLVPEEDAKVEELFRVLCDCAALNPDDVADEDGVGEFFFDEDEIMAGLDPETRAAVVAHQLSSGLDLEEGGEEDLQQLVAGDPGRFDDDEYEEEGGEDQGSADGSAATHVSNGQL
ncbi:MAG: hypothetical protein WDW36_008704 [Sanguina aurantia]